MFPKIYCLHDITRAPTVLTLDDDNTDSKERNISYKGTLDDIKGGTIHQILVFTDGPWPDEYSRGEIDIYLNNKDRKLCTLSKSQRCFLWCKDDCKDGFDLISGEENNLTVSASLQGTSAINLSENTDISTPLSTSLSEGEIMQKANETTPVVVNTSSNEKEGKMESSESPIVARTPIKQSKKKDSEKGTPDVSSRKSKKRQLDKENLSSPSTPKLKAARSKRGSKVFGHVKTPDSKRNSSSMPTTTIISSSDSTLSNTPSKTVHCVQLPSRVPKPSSRWGHSMCMVDDKTAVLIGGQGTNMQLSKDSVWTLDTESRTWKSSAVITDGVKPENRTGHSATYDPTMRCIYVFGGSKNSKWFHDVHMYDLDDQKWTLVKVNGKAPTRAYHSATLFRHELWIFGGVFPRPNLQPDGCDNELHIFSPVMEGWYKPIVTGDKPLPRSGHSANLVDDRLFVFGGWDFPFCYNDVHILDLTTLDWSSPKITGEPPKPRCWSASSTLTNSQVFIHGGYDGDNPLDDAFIFNLDTYTWQTLTLEKAPSPRAGHACMRLSSNYESREEDEIIIFGGGDNDGNFFSDMLSLYIPYITTTTD